MFRIENWAIVALSSDPFQPPEVWARGLHGNVFGHPDFKDGEEVTTSTIVSGRREGDRIVIGTKSGSEYELGQVHPDYEAQFPNSLERVTKQFV